MKVTFPNKSRAAEVRALADTLERLDRRKALAEDCSRMEASLSEFFKGAWTVLEPGRKLAWSWHYDLIAEYLWLVREGTFHEKFPDITCVIFNVPPRTAKSTLISICFPVWCWIAHPDMRWMSISHDAGLSEEHSVKRRDLIQSGWFQERWGGKFNLKIDQNTKSHFSNDKTGSMIATSVTGAGLGQGGDNLIFDDPIDPKKALSEAERTTTVNLIDQTFRTRLNDPSSGLVILVMQRLHELDPTGYLLASDAGHCLHISIPLEAEEPERWEFPVSGRVVTREIGELLQPDRFAGRTVGMIRNRLTWAGQYQQRPAPLEGNMIKRSEVKFYGGIDPRSGIADDPRPKNDEFDMVIVSADCAFKETGDYVAVGTIGVKGRKRYVLDLVNKHLDLDATETEILRQRNTWHASTVLVEDKANGSAAIKHLKNVCSGVIAIEPQGGKASRMAAMCPEWQAGDWYLDRNAGWSEVVIQQLISFPNAAHDDICDCFSQSAVHLQGSRWAFLEVLREQAAAIQPQREFAPGIPMPPAPPEPPKYDWLAGFR